MKRLVLILALALGGAARGQTLTLTPGEMRAAATAAAAAGDFSQASALAQALLLRDPGDAAARIFLAQAALAAGDAGAARDQARAFWRLAEDPGDRYQAARLAAFAAMRDGAPFAAELWLRRAATVATTAAQQDQIAEDFRAVRARNPWSVDLNFSAAPSDNVNGGSETAFNVIEGFPIVGALSPDARALSGWSATLDAELSYRLRANERSLTSLGLVLGGRAVWLDRAARDFIEEEQDPGDPPIRNGDFSSARAELALTHRLALGRGAAELSLALGRVWAQGDADHDLVRLSASRDLTFGPQAVQVSAFIEQRWTPDGAEGDQRQGLGVEWQRAFGWGQVAVNLSWAQNLSDQVNRLSQAWTLTTEVAPAATLGPVAWSVTLGGQWTDYPDYRVIFAVPGGRQDDRLFADLELSAPGVSYAGFRPVVTFGYDRIDSNVSRFARDGLSVDFSLRSVF